MTSTTIDENAPKTAAWGSSHFLVVALLFLFSGLSSLIYQVIWTRQLVFVFGSTGFASATVLSAFMGGLALGSYYAGKYCDRMRNPFLWYGLLEGVIGLWALITPFLLGAALPLYKSFWSALHDNFLAFSLLRFFVVALILLPPTACMGATLPLLSRFVTSSLAIVGSRVGTLYSINTCGAVIGAVLAGFVLIPSMGLSATTISAAGMNFLLAVVVYALQKSWAGSFGIPTGKDGFSLAADPAAPASDGATPPADLTAADTSASGEGAAAKVLEKEKLPPHIFWTMAAFGASGALAMMHEVGWTRALLLIIGSTTYAFTIMLATFLVGIFLGSLAMSRLADKVKDPLCWFSALQLGLCAAGLLSIYLFNYLPYWNLVTNYNYIDNPDGGMIVRFLLTACVLLPVTLCLGAVFPLAVKVCTRDLERVGRSVGTLYSINTLGAIIGAFVAGFAIIPAVGSEQTLLWACAGSGIIGGALLFAFGPKTGASRIIAGVLSLAILVWVCTTPQIWNLRMVTSSQKVRRGLVWNRKPPDPFDIWVKEVDKAFNILFWKDGIASNVAVIQFPDQQVSLLTNGHIDASTGRTDMSTQALLPTIPLLVKTGATEVGDVGWGSGTTMGYSLLFPIKKMVCAEIEPAVIETSKWFHTVNLAPEKDPRLIINYNDGRNYMMATDETFDVITSEPSNPWQAGVCNLYTQEYFQVCHDRLKPGGIFAMWWQYNEVSSDNLSRVFSSLKKVFKHVVVFQVFTGDISAIASDEPIKINLKNVNQALQDPKLKQTLSLFTGINCAEDLPAKVCLSDDSITKIAAQFPPNTDDKNHIEFDVARTYEQKNFSAQNQQWMVANAGPIWDAVDWTGMTTTEQALKMAEIAERGMVQNLPMCELWAGQSFKVQKNPYALCVQALIEAQKKGNFEGAYIMANEAVTKFPKEAKWLCVKGIVELLGGAPMRARKDFAEAVKLEPSNLIYKFRLAQTYLPDLREWYQISILPLADEAKPTADPKKVVELLAASMSDNNFVNQNPNAVALYAAGLIGTGKFKEGANLVQQFLKVKADDRIAWALLAEAHQRMGDSINAQLYSRKASELGDAMALRFAQNAANLGNQGKFNLAVALIRKALLLNPAAAQPRNVLWQIADRGDDGAEKLMQELSKLSLEDAQAYQRLIQKKGSGGGGQMPGLTPQVPATTLPGATTTDGK
ncbi:MAG: fused MFS/spermidine synthase [Candidatus Obscuribacterales bacterium]|nr:fused MFS/spermidine synthase [Candidatus Obscuribacterales bacterium]